MISTRNQVWSRLIAQPLRSSARIGQTINLAPGVATDCLLLRKEVIQPQVPLRLPCYDFIPVTSLALGHCLLAVGACTSGETSFHDVTGGVYKTRERIHRGKLIRDY